MKITYEFDTNSEDYKDDSYTQERFSKSFEMALALTKLDDVIHSWYNRDEREAIPVEEIRNTFNDILDSEGIVLDRLIY